MLALRPSCECCDEKNRGQSALSEIRSMTSEKLTSEKQRVEQHPAAFIESCSSFRPTSR